MARWLRLEDARKLTRDPWMRAMLSKDRPGIYADEQVTRLKVFYDVLERDARGRLHRRQRTRTFRIDDEHEIDGERVDALAVAIDFKSRRESEVALQRVRAHDVTLGDLFEQYMTTKEHRPSTASNYRYSWAKHIEPQLGGYALRNLDVPAVEAWARDLDAGPEAKAKAARLLRALTSFAHRRGMMPTDPGRVLVVPASRARALRPDEIPTKADVERLAEEVSDRYRAVVLLLGLGGLRIGEAIALRVDRIDFDRRRITVDASASEVGGVLTFGKPKTHAGERSFTAPSVLLDALREHIERYPSDSGLVFTAPDGGPLRPGNFRSRVFDPAADRAGLGGLHLHDLRHTCASTLAAAGASAGEIAHRLGQANVAVTQQVYMHVLRSRDEALAAMQDEAWGV
jgi:integrase